MITSAVFYRVKRVKGHYYLVKEWWDPGLKRKITKSLGPCDKIEQLVEAARKDGWCRGRDLNPGFPPGRHYPRIPGHGLERPAYLAGLYYRGTPSNPQ